MGGSYELEIDLGPGSEERLIAVLRALWSQTELEGPFSDRAGKHQAVPGSDVSIPLYGVATLHDGALVPCCSLTLGNGDALNFSVPLDGLRAAWPEVGEFPFGDPAGVRAWQEPLEEWFAGIARAVFDRTPFTVAVIGFEVEPLDDREIPDERTYAVLRREQDDLVWYPTTKWGGPVGVPWGALRDVTSQWRRVRRGFRAPD